MCAFASSLGGFALFGILKLVLELLVFKRGVLFGAVEL
jgi:hypothetical protein